MIMPKLIFNTYVNLMYEHKKTGKVFTSKFVGTGPSSYKKNYRASVSQRLRNTDIEEVRQEIFHLLTIWQMVGKFNDLNFSAFLIDAKVLWFIFENKYE